MTKGIFSAFIVFGFFGISAVAQKGEGPCKKIVEACQAAGFIKGDWKKGDGLWRDCVDPIIQGQTSVPGATKPLPTVDPASVAACKAKRPKFGEGKVGSTPQTAPKPH